MVLNMLRTGTAGISDIARWVGLSSQIVLRIKADRGKAEAAMKTWHSHKLVP
ncbi:hypothetical protein J5Y06_15095 [Tianweitania sediminis]|uniref:Uncharacterized protein n=1 Tax=Tianweitania sediminis TaxID=1502156 RepID=A0A8J7UI81_9HYPH|nr:hypothetical protein [Tianweitania sediminis]